MDKVQELVDAESNLQNIERSLRRIASLSGKLTSPRQKEIHQLATAAVSMARAVRGQWLAIEREARETEIEPPWSAEIGEQVMHVRLNTVGTVTHVNPAVDDEVCVDWASQPASWVKTDDLVPYPN